jgi:hypothetical protein
MRILEDTVLLPQEDSVTQSDLEQLLDAFPDQPLDFYGAIRCQQLRCSLQGFIATRVHIA